MSDALALPLGPFGGSGAANQPQGPASAREPDDAAITRRRLLMLAGAASAAAMLRPSELAAPGAAAAVANPLLRSRFVPHIGETFRLAAPGAGAIGVRLDEVRDLGWKPDPTLAGSEDGFTLLFRGPSQPRLGQDVMRVSHPRLGRLDLLVAPAGTGRRGQDYAAVINRLVPPKR